MKKLTSLLSRCSRSAWVLRWWSCSSSGDDIDDAHGRFWRLGWQGRDRWFLVAKRLVAPRLARPGRLARVAAAMSRVLRTLAALPG